MNFELSSLNNPMESVYNIVSEKLVLMKLVEIIFLVKGFFTKTIKKLPPV